ncbi:MAG: hypothetical protein J6K28_04440 [Alistipes sp.]|nr:hypothetical protein [Alistipes sp.]
MTKFARRSINGTGHLPSSFPSASADAGAGLANACAQQRQRRYEINV